MDSRNYRDQLYRLRAHPARPPEGFRDGRDSFGRVYFSILPFAALEYMVEVSSEVIPGGLVFPIGFLLFWSYFYSFYQPGFLEERLSNPRGAVQSWAGAPGLLLGLVFWFVKVTFTEAAQFFHGVVRATMGKTKAAHSSAKRHANASSGAGPSFKAKPSATAGPKPPPLLPPDVIQSLGVLGLRPGCNWDEIHRQYRKLAKQFHPDLHPEETDFGRRFIRVDAAYHHLAKFRERFFS